MDPKVELDLVKLARQGNKNAFSLLIERYQPMAQRLALSMVNHESIARELVQEAMLQAYLSLAQLKHEERFRSWFYGIILNVCRSYIRDQKINFFSWEAVMGGVQAPALYLTQLQPTIQEITEARELHRLVLAAVQALSPKNREATFLFYYEDLSLQEIANSLGISVTAVKGRLHKSRKQLKEWLLPLYLDLNERNRPMVKVEVVDVITEKVEAEGDEKQVEWTIVALLDPAGGRILPIWVGPFEGRAIAAGVQGFDWPRPVTFNFVVNLLQATGVELEQVVVSELRDETFYAIARLRNGDKVEEIDARPSDAIAIAVQLNTPIYVAAEVMDKAGIDVSAEMTQTPQLGHGIETIIKELESSLARSKQTYEAFAKEQEEQKEKRHQKVKALLFGGES
jgi:RNA polymerase sigma factor (sigma-70 family)